MPRSINKLTAVEVRNITEPGLYPDGGGLYLQVSRSKSKSWILRFKINGKTRDMGLGATQNVTLANARRKASEYKNMVHAGQDPIEIRKTQRQENRFASTITANTFAKCREEYIKTHKASWSNSKHQQQWENTLITYAESVFGNIDVSQIDTSMVKQCLDPIWNTKTETATRVRNRIESILDWAKVKGFRSGENPARWKGHLDQLLPAPTRIRARRHHAALPYTDIYNFMNELRTYDSISAMTLEFTILTACRTQETIGARWDELDLQERIWTIPAERMKMNREHRVPLSGRAIKIIEQMEKIRQNDYVFPGTKEGKPQSNMAMLNLLKRMQKQNLTVHGFRSTFRDWVAEATLFSGEVAEMALAHKVMNDVEAAYRRGDLLNKRRELMDAWCDYCYRKNGENKHASSM